MFMLRDHFPHASISSVCMSNLSAGMMYAERLDSTTKRFVDTEASIAPNLFLVANMFYATS